MICSLTLDLSVPWDNSCLDSFELQESNKTSCSARPFNYTHQLSNASAYHPFGASGSFWDRIIHHCFNHLQPPKGHLQEPSNEKHAETNSSKDLPPPHWEQVKNELLQSHLDCFHSNSKTSGLEPWHFASTSANTHLWAAPLLRFLFAALARSQSGGSWVWASNGSGKRRCVLFVLGAQSWYVLCVTKTCCWHMYMHSWVFDSFFDVIWTDSPWICPLSSQNKSVLKSWRSSWRPFDVQSSSPCNARAVCHLWSCTP